MKWRADPSLGPLPREGAAAQSAEIDFALHGGVALDFAIVGDGQGRPLCIDVDGELDVLAGDRAGEIRLTKRSLVLAGQLVASLLEHKRGVSTTPVGLHVERPFTAHINLSLG